MSTRVVGCGEPIHPAPEPVTWPPSTATPGWVSWARTLDRPASVPKSIAAVAQLVILVSMTQPLGSFAVGPGTNCTPISRRLPGWLPPSTNPPTQRQPLRVIRTPTPPLRSA
jgi:hypothetical protein